MSFPEGPGTVAGIVAAALAAAVALGWTEWRRADRRRRGLRLGATGLALLGLALLGLRPARGGGSSPHDGTGAALYTAAVTPPDGPPSPDTVGRRFALPAARHAPQDAVVLPGVATLRERLPPIGTLHLYGDGLEPFDLDALRGLRVVFHPAAPIPAQQPAITFLRCPRVLPLGAPLEIQGRVDGLPPGESAVVTLASPDGSTTEAPTLPADPKRSAVFAVRGPAPAAAGRFNWRLRLTRGHDALADETLGVAVMRPALPRVLVLESTPRFDTTALRRWLEQAGSALTARTLVGKDLYRFLGSASKGSAPREFAAVDAVLLAGYDLVLADGRALGALSDAERTTLHAAVSDTGLGLLLLADDAVLPPAPAGGPAAIFLPWTLRAAGGGDPSPDPASRAVRLRWPGMDQPGNTPVATAPWEIDLWAGQSALVRDEQGRALAAAAPLGRGWLALTLVRETDRWNRANDPAAFAAYWSHLLSLVARPDDAGHWTLPGGEAGPVRVDEPLELVWQGPGGAPPAPARVTDEAGESAALPFLGDPSEPTRWRTTFWPRRTGWHRVAAGGGGALDFYVATPAAWPALAAARRRAATARFAAGSADGAAPMIAAHPAESEPIPAGWWFTLFFVGAGTLWMERRLASSSR